MDEMHQFWRFGVAMALGLIVGLQREHSSGEAHAAEGPGVRTFAITSLLGTALSWFSMEWQSVLPLTAGILALGLMSAVTFYVRAQQGNHGMTTDVSLLLMFVVGALCWRNQLVLATAIAVAMTVLLTFKMQLHRFAHTLTQTDVVAVIKFLVITVIVLPILPDQVYGPEPFHIFNPFKIWLLVVFISAISFVGYILVKLVGADRGIGMTGFLGGLASSTALTLSFTQRSKTSPQLSSTLATGIVVAWTVMYARVLGIVWMLSPELGQTMALPMLVPVVPGLAWCVWLWIKERGHRLNESQIPDFSNPFELAPAIKFVFLLMIVLAISKFARMQFGDSGLLISSFVAGLADVDAIAVSVAQMSQKEGSSFLTNATMAVVLAGIANTLTKGGIALFMGAPAMRRAIGPAMVLMISSGIIALFLI